MPGGRDSARPRLSKFAILVGLAVTGQLVARWIAGRYVLNLGAPAQRASIIVDLILVACVPFGLFSATSLSLPGTPLLDCWIRGETVAPQFSRGFYRSIVLALISLAAALAVSLIPHPRTQVEGINAPIPLPLANL